MTPANDNRPASFDAMLTRLYPRVRNYATRYRSHDADDLAQTAMESACRNWRSYRQGTSMMPWLVGYVMNAARAPLPLPTNDAALARIASPPTQEEYVSCLQAIALVPDDSRDLIALVATGHDVTEAAAMSGISHKAARFRLASGRSALRRATVRASVKYLAA
ncbi:RNA polymerase sigma factor [Bosea sp. NPDC055332]